MKKIKVPEGMLAAVNEAISKARMSKASRSAMAEGNPELRLGEIVRVSVEAACLWLSKNPSQPDEEQMEALCGKYTWLDKDSVRYGAREWQRIVFLAPPEPNPVVTRIKQSLQGQTLTAGDAVELMDAVRMCTSPEEGPTLDQQRALDLMRNGYASDYVKQVDGA